MTIPVYRLKNDMECRKKGYIIKQRKKTKVNDRSIVYKIPVNVTKCTSAKLTED